MSINQHLQIADWSDEKFFEETFRTYYAQLAGFAYRYVEDYDLAGEITQELFSSIWSKSSSIEIQTSVKSYLFGAVRNACLNHIKHQRIVRSHSEHVLRVSSEADHSNPVELGELKNKIENALAKLPKKCREIFELSRFENLKYREIADRLNLSQKTVENQMGKALKIMREELANYLPILIWLWESLNGGKI